MVTSKSKQSILRTVQERAEQSGYSPATIRELVNTGRLPHVRFGRVIRISDDAWDAFVAAHTIPAKVRN